MANNHDHHGSSGHGHHGHAHVVVPFKVYVNTLLALLVLTVITVGASYLDFGKLNFTVAMAIASVKAALVMMFFMGLKYDSNLNRAYILSSFVALVLMVGFSASDLWTRDKPKPAKVKSAAAALSVEELNKMMTSTPELVAHGKGLYNTNCAVCHGADGKGDGAGGAALNPKPRNFHGPAGDWKNGSSFKSVYVTLAYGIPNSGMASYKALPPADRVALIHYVHSLTEGGAGAGKADDRYAAAIKEDGIGAGGGGAPKASVPVEFAIERMIKN